MLRNDDLFDPYVVHSRTGRLLQEAALAELGDKSLYMELIELLAKQRNCTQQDVVESFEVEARRQLTERTMGCSNGRTSETRPPRR